MNSMLVTKMPCRVHPVMRTLRVVVAASMTNAIKLACILSRMSKKIGLRLFFTITAENVDKFSCFHS